MQHATYTLCKCCSVHSQRKVHIQDSQDVTKRGMGKTRCAVCTVLRPGVTLITLPSNPFPSWPMVTKGFSAITGVSLSQKSVSSEQEQHPHDSHTIRYETCHFLDSDRCRGLLAK